jgi:hypothetical protein
LSRADLIWKWVFLVACVLSFLLEVIPGRSPMIDEEFFKSAGRHWAATGQFAAPEIVGRVDVKPGFEEVYFAQPPIYTFAFGVYTKIIGFGPRLCILYDQLIHLFFVLMTMLLARVLFRVPPSYTYAIGTFLLFNAMFGRPDELAMSIGVAGILCWTLNQPPSRRAILAGIAFGLCGSTSIGVFTFFAPMALLVAYQRQALRISTFLIAVATGAAVACCCIAPILIAHPDAYRQLIVHAQVQSPELGQAVDAGQSRFASILKSYKDGAHNVFAYHRDIAFIILAALAVVVLCLFRNSNPRARMLRQCLWVAIAGLILEWVLLPGKAPYLWFFAPWLLSLAAASWIALPRDIRQSRKLVASILTYACVFFVMLDYARERAAILVLPPEQSFTVAMHRVRTLVPTGATVVTSDYWWALADKCKVLDPYMSNPKPVYADYFVKPGNGNDNPGEAKKFFDIFENYSRDHHFVVVADDVNKTPPRIGSIALYPGVKGFGALILANPETTGHTAAPDAVR